MNNKLLYFEISAENILEFFALSLKFYRIQNNVGLPNRVNA